SYLDPQRAQRIENHLVPVRDEEDQVAGLRACPLQQRIHLFLAEELRYGRPDAAFLHGYPRQSLCPVRLYELTQAVDLFPAEPGAALGIDGPHAPAAGDRICKYPETA